MRRYSRILFFILAAFASASCIYQIPSGSIYLTNNSPYPITAVHYGDSETDVWSVNLLAVAIQPDELGIVEGIPREVVDVKIVFGDADATTNITTQDLTIVNRLNLIVSFPEP